jgi:hypothetical protein
MPTQFSKSNILAFPSVNTVRSSSSYVHIPDSCFTVKSGSINCLSRCLNIDSIEKISCGVPRDTARRRPYPPHVVEARDFSS